MCLIVLKKNINPITRESLSQVTHVQQKHKEAPAKDIEESGRNTRKNSQNSVKALLGDLIEFSPSKGLCLKQIAFTIIQLL